jgi:hypothetical protein
MFRPPVFTSTINRILNGDQHFTLTKSTGTLEHDRADFIFKGLEHDCFS